MNCAVHKRIVIAGFILTAFGCGKGGQAVVKEVGKEVLQEGVSRGKDALIEHNNREREASKTKLKEDMQRIARERAGGKVQSARPLP